MAVQDFEDVFVVDGIRVYPFSRSSRRSRKRENMSSVVLGGDAEGEN
jgi:hypothetical protein